MITAGFLVKNTANAAPFPATTAILSMVESSVSKEPQFHRQRRAQMLRDLKIVNLANQATLHLEMFHAAAALMTFLLQVLSIVLSHHYHPFCAIWNVVQALP